MYPNILGNLKRTRKERSSFSDSLVVFGGYVNTLQMSVYNLSDCKEGLQKTLKVTQVTSIQNVKFTIATEWKHVTRTISSKKK